MTKSVKQHWVPQFYLRGFATQETIGAKKKKVWALHRDDGEPFIVNVDDVAAKRHLYTPACPRGERDWWVDDKLTSLEDTVSKIWDSVANDYVDLSDDFIRMALSLFVSTLILRHPGNIENIKNLHDAMVGMWDQAPKDSVGRPCGTIHIDGKEHVLDNSGWEEYKNATEYDHNSFFVSLIESEAINIAELLMKKRWSVVVSEMPVFITTDNPVILQNMERERYGLSTKGTLLTFPLSPTRMLCMDDRHEEPASQYYQLRDDLWPIFNQALWVRAYRFMISNRNPVDVLSEIVQFSECFLDNGYA